MINKEKPKKRESKLNKRSNKLSLLERHIFKSKEKCSCRKSIKLKKSSDSSNKAEKRRSKKCKRRACKRALKFKKSLNKTMP